MLILLIIKFIYIFDINNITTISYVCFVCLPLDDTGQYTRAHSWSQGIIVVPGWQQTQEGNIQGKHLPAVVSL